MNSTELAVASGVVAGTVMFALTAALAMWVLLVIARWRMFTKAGEKGWKSLIPLYSDYTMFKLVWNTKSFWIYVACGLAMILAMVFSGAYAIVDGQIVVVSEGSFLMGIVSFIGSTGLLVYSALLAIKTSYAYGKGMVFALGLLFLPNVFSLILGFGSAQYKGPQE